MEAIDFQMADAADLPEDTNIDTGDLHNIKQIGSTTPLYANLLVLVRALLALPASNADSERSFSMVRKIDSNIASLLTLKLNLR